VPARKRARIFFFILLMMSAHLTRSCEAEGALALGFPSDAPKYGVAIGWTVNFPNATEAEKRAMELCTSYEGTGPPAREACTVVDTFAKECLAIALDSEPGADGFGWAVRQTRSKAEHDAVANCRATANQGRVQLCKVVASCCDGRRCELKK